MQQSQLIQPFVPGIAFDRNRDTAHTGCWIFSGWFLPMGGRRAGLTASWSS